MKDTIETITANILAVMVSTSPIIIIYEFIKSMIKLIF